MHLRDRKDKRGDEGDEGDDEEDERDKPQAVSPSSFWETGLPK